MKHLALLLLVVPMLAFAADDLISPYPGELPRRMSATEAEKTLQLAFLDLGWVITKVSPGVVEAEIELRGRHRARVEARYTDTSIAMHYVDSSGLDYEQCKRNPKKTCINDNYHAWLSNVIKALPNALQKLQLFGILAQPDATPAQAPASLAPAAPSPPPPSPPTGF